MSQIPVARVSHARRCAVIASFIALLALGTSGRAQTAGGGSTSGPPATQPAAELLRPAGDVPPVVHHYDPTDAYELQHIEGWTVRVNKRLLSEQPELAQKTLDLMHMQLFQIPRVVPAEAVEKLRKVTIWIELDDPMFPCMCYHAEHGWVVGHGLNPEKTHGVELANPHTFLTWTVEQPWMVLHELSHAYHDQFLPRGFDNPEVLKAYENAKDHDLYKAILRNNGRTETAYAMTNPMEYFAECSEAFFGTNDFYPFIRVELKVHDPQGYEMMRKMWGVDKDKMLWKSTTRPTDEQTWVK